MKSRRCAYCFHPGVHQDCQDFLAQIDATVREVIDIEQMVKAEIAAEAQDAMIEKLLRRRR